MSVARADALPALSRHELVNAKGDRVIVLEFGARIAGIELQLKSGPRRVVLAYADARDYLRDPYFLGASVGRYCNRIRDAAFAIDGRTYRLAANEGRHQLHGGPDGFWRRRWVAGGGANHRQVELCLVSPDGDQGFPGTLNACVRISWNDERELTFRYSASSDQPTHVNLSHHGYFNLDGADDGDVLGHCVQIAADAITDIDDALLPTGTLARVTGTPLDLRRSTRLAALVHSEDRRVGSAGGADFNYVLDEEDPAATVTNGRGDLAMSVHTTCPGLQLYSGQHLRAPFRPCQGFCLEAQYFPDSPNQRMFPATLVGPGRPYNESTTYRFLEL